MTQEIGAAILVPYTRGHVVYIRGAGQTALYEWLTLNLFCSLHVLWAYIGQGNPHWAYMCIGRAKVCKTTEYNNTAGQNKRISPHLCRYLFFPPNSVNRECALGFGIHYRAYILLVMDDLPWVYGRYLAEEKYQRAKPNIYPYTSGRS